jgi:hypothetical protein
MSVNSYLLGRTYRTALQQILKMFTIFPKTNSPPFLVVSCYCAKRFWVSVANRLFSRLIIFKFL